jgi:AhpD family alkylhydroperoxidase
MARISFVPVEQWDPALRDLIRPDQRTPLEQGLYRIFAHRPDLAMAVADYGRALRQNRTLPDRLVELVRLRIAFHNQCRSCMAIRYGDAVADGLTEDLVCSLEQPMEASDLTEAERAAIRYGELFATNHLAIDDGVYDELRRHFTEGEIVELGLHVALCVGIGRLAATWSMVEELPDRFRADGEITPWGGDAVTVR